MGQYEGGSWEDVGAVGQTEHGAEAVESDCERQVGSERRVEALGHVNVVILLCHPPN